MSEREITLDDAHLRLLAREARQSADDMQRQFSGNTLTAKSRLMALAYEELIERRRASTDQEGMEYVPQLIRYDSVEAGDPYWEFIGADVTAVTGPMRAANVEMLYDLQDHAKVIGLRVYDSSLSTEPMAPEGGEWDECAATGQSCHYGPHGPKGEQQCEFCGKASPAPVQQGGEVAVAQMLGPWDMEGDSVIWLEGCERLSAGDLLYAHPGAHEADAKAFLAAIARAEASEARAKELAKALQFYADPKSYHGPNQRADEGDEHTVGSYRVDVTRDGGDIARAALLNVKDTEHG